MRRRLPLLALRVIRCKAALRSLSGQGGHPMVGGPAGSVANDPLAEVVGFKGRAP
jgi:hypothetical protein